MSIRTFIFCDVCNPQAIRSIHNADHFGRRISDGRAWYEGPIHEASKLGWVVTHEDHNVCPDCHQKGLERLLEKTEPKTKDDQAQVLMRV
ncbi:hypothetical protein [Sulfuriflexus mobilis]|uniref:hypothetical protein n=1 Tax=Sulfuriflexus mobilis TaxID=1811807 RepID=UPI000F84BE23|nr:hypothetical protein [Sulfuriflexus mobilis]